jgi:hypothetical protein
MKTKEREIKRCGIRLWQAGLWGLLPKQREKERESSQTDAHHCSSIGEITTRFHPLAE